MPDILVPNTPAPASSTRRAALLALGVLAFFAASTSAGPVLADDNVVLKLMLNGFAADPRMDAAKVSTGPWVDEPDAVKGTNVRLKADGPMYGGGFRATFAIDRTRISLGMNVFGLDNATFTHAPIASPDLYTRTGMVWGESVDLALGREFRVGPIFPYLDLRMCMDLVAANLELHSWSNGLLGSTGYTDFSLGLGPMGGVFVPLDEVFFFDLAGYAGLVGAERYAGFAGFGVWVNGSHL